MQKMTAQCEDEKVLCEVSINLISKRKWVSIILIDKLDGQQCYHVVKLIDFFNRASLMKS